jgi:hypothetical protein
MGAHGTVVRYAGNAPGVSNLVVADLPAAYSDTGTTEIVLSGQESPGPVASSCTAT